MLGDGEQVFRLRRDLTDSRELENVVGTDTLLRAEEPGQVERLRVHQPGVLGQPLADLGVGEDVRQLGLE